jgi:hypothetical protein
MAKTRHKVSSLDVISRIFSKQISANSLGFRFRSLHELPIENLFNRCGHKYDQLISRIFFISFFGGFLTFNPNISKGKKASNLNVSFPGKQPSK